MLLAGVQAPRAHRQIAVGWVPPFAGKVGQTGTSALVGPGGAEARCDDRHAQRLDHQPPVALIGSVRSTGCEVNPTGVNPAGPALDPSRRAVFN